MTKDNLNVLTIGAGAIGTYVGGSLALAGNHVTFLERQDAAKKIRSHGLTLKIHNHPQRITAPNVITSLESVFQKNHFDFVIFALKSFDTQPFIDTILPYFTALPPFLCLSNGVDNEQILAEAIGWDRVIAGTVTSAVSRQDAGCVTLERFRGIGIAKDHPLSSRISIEMNRAGLGAHLFSRAVDMKWSKMLTNLIANASSAILNLPPGQVYAHPQLFQFEIMQLREALAVMRSQEIKVINLPGIPVQPLAFTIQYLPLRISKALLQKAVIGGRGEKMPSLFIDLNNHRGKSEVNDLNGAVVRAGKKYNIPTPVNQFLTETLMGLTTGEIESNAYQGQPDKLISHLSTYLSKTRNGYV
jgi:2-dehydropantoate 2-reductase